MASDIFRPEQWNEFFVMVGGAAALTGLVFVAMSLNLYVIFHDATHRARAVGTLRWMPNPAKSARTVDPAR